jgi:hypothetical protein
VVAVERNNHGHGVLAYLASDCADVNVYHRMLENFAAVLANAPFLFASPRLLEECKTFVRRTDGSSAAANGAHDDTVMAMAVALAVRAEVAGMAPAKQKEMEMATL